MAVASVPSVHALPFALALASGALLAPGLLRSLRRAGAVRANYRGRELPFPLGVLVLAGALTALIPVELVERLARANVLEPRSAVVWLYPLGVIALGLADDTLGEGRPGAGAPRGWRGHARALRRGELSTGALKALGSAGLALAAMGAYGFANGRWLLAAAVLLAATNVFNQLDLRPGRSGKAFVVLAVALCAGSADLRPLWILGIFTGPALVAWAYDLRERAMLGDTGSNLLGALAGLWIVLTLAPAGQLIALALLAALGLYGELHSLSELIERIPLLRKLDSLGRPS